MGTLRTAALAATMVYALTAVAHANQYSVTVAVGSVSEQGGYDSNKFPGYDGRFGMLGGASVSAQLRLDASTTNYQTNPPLTQTVSAPVTTTFEFSYLGFRILDSVVTNGTFSPIGSDLIQGRISASDTLFGIFPNALLSVLDDGTTEEFAAFGVPRINGAAQGLDFTRGNTGSSYSLSGTVTFTYYDGPVPVPEPATLALFGSLIGLGTLVHKRRRTTT